MDSDLRLAQLNEWIKETLGAATYSLTPVFGDASFRRYSRLVVDNKQYIAVDAPPEKENNNALLSYFISLLPLGWAVAALNHMNSDIVFSSKILTFSSTAITASLISIFITSRWIKNRNPLIVPAPILGLAGCTLFISLISAGAIVYTLLRYYPV